MSSLKTSPVQPTRAAGDVSFQTMAETIGKQFKLRREAKNLTIQKVVQATHIRAYQIEAIEADEFDSLPSPVQARAYIRLYAEFLGFSVEELITRQHTGVNEPTTDTLEPTPSPNIQAEPSIETDAEPTSFENRVVGKQQNTLISRIRRVMLRQKEAVNSNAPAEANEVPESSETEQDETAHQPKDAPVQTSVSEPLPSQLIFIAIGKTLRERRESLSLTLDEIERHTHVRKYYLQALEDGEFERLPSSVQARGMVNNYAHFLNLEVDALLLTFAEGLQTQRLERQPSLDETTQKPTSKFKTRSNQPKRIIIPAAIRRYLSVDIFVGSGLVLLLLTFAIWGTNRIINLRAGYTPQPTAPSISNILISTPEIITESPTATSIGNGDSTRIPLAGETEVVTIPAAGQGAVQVVVVAQEQTWVRVTVDGKIKLEGRVSAGTAYSFDGNTQIEVLTGNGRAISILYNQNNLGPMGNIGEVVDHIYTANAILNPTATFTPTPSITPKPTVTLRPSVTPRSSYTPRFTTTPSQ